MVCYGIFWSGQLDDYNLQIKTGVLVCGNMHLMLTKLLTLLKRERGGVQLVLLFMSDSSLTNFFFERIFFFGILELKKVL